MTVELERPIRKRPPRPRAVRALPESPAPTGQLQEPGVDFERLCEMLRECNAVWFHEHLQLDALRGFVSLLDSVAETGRKRLQTLITKATEATCANPKCGRALPHGRFAGEIIIRDAQTQELVPLRACSEPCYREVAMIAAERRAHNTSSVVRGSVAL